MLSIEHIDYRGMERLSNNYDVVYLIVRSLKDKDRGVLLGYDNIFHKPKLSPSTDLFFKYRKAANAGLWNQEYFQKYYVPQFLHEMYQQRDSLIQLYLEAQKRNIAIACFCQDETMCHRSIIAGLMQGVAKFRNEAYLIDCAADYSEYHRLYWNLNGNKQQM